MNVTQTADSARREIMLTVSDAPDIDADITSTGKAMRVTSIVVEFSNENGGPWVSGFIRVTGLSVNKNGRVSTARDSEFTNLFLARSANTPAWIREVAQGCLPDQG